jgi:hypothetical protein
MQTTIIPERVRNQLSPQELSDIAAGIQLCSLYSSDDKTIAAFIEVSLLALGFNHGERSN